MHIQRLLRSNQTPGVAAWLIVFCAFLLEIFLFNGQAFALTGRQAEASTIQTANFTLSGFSVDPADPTLLKPDNNVEHAIIIKDIDLEAFTLWLNVTGMNPQVVQGQVYATDTASSHTYKVIDSFRLISNFPRSEYLRLHLDGATTEIKITFALVAGQDLRIPSIVINKPIPMDFSLVRFGLLAMLGLMVLFLRRSPICARPRIPGDHSQAALLVMTGLVVILIGVVISTAAAGGKLLNLQAENGDIYSRDLTNALAAGQLHLLIVPPPELAALANPYDSTLRAYAGIHSALWDAAYYQGHYYIYFGIVPALLLFVPFHLVSGLYLPSIWAVILFSAVSIIFLIMLLDRILAHFFPRLPFRFYIPAALALTSGSYLWWCLSRPKFYEVAITGGMCFGVIGLYLLFRSWQDQQAGLRRYLRLSVGCLSLALAVGTRPNLLLLSLIPLPLFWQLLRHPVPAPLVLPPPPPRRFTAFLARFRVLLAVGLPYLLTGGALMVYNFLRFGKITEFGASYQLTVTDMGIRGSLNPARLAPGFWNFLFNFPVVNATFPFIHFQTGKALDYSGYFYSDDHCAGLLVTLPICWLLFAWPWLRPVLRRTSRELRRLLAIILGVAVLLTGVDSMAAGSAGRYLTDFAWLWILAAILLAAALTNHTVHADTREPDAAAALPAAGAHQQTVLSVFGLLCGLTVAVALLLALQGENEQVLANHARDYYLLERFLAFWLP